MLAAADSLIIPNGPWCVAPEHIGPGPAIYRDGKFTAEVLVSGVVVRGCGAFQRAATGRCTPTGSCRRVTGLA